MMKKLWLIVLACAALAVQAETTRYVWAVNGMDLRQSPADSAPVLRKLPYGTAVEVLQQDASPVAYQFAFSTARDTSATLTQLSATQPPVMLNGQWLKVSAGDQQGYLFSGLLLDKSPIRKQETPEAYLVRVLNLKGGAARVKREKSESPGIVNVLTARTFTAKDGSATLKSQSNKGDASVFGDGGDLTIRQMSFEQALVFFSAIMPPLADHGFEYVPGQRFVYLLDEIGNTAELKKTGNGVSFGWFYGLN